MDEALSTLNKICPEMSNAPKIWYPSSSSFICREDGTQLTGLRGQRIYVPVDDARETPRLVNAIWMRSWALGLGYIRIGLSVVKS
jgi:hypothetical protein